MSEPCREGGGARDMEGARTMTWGECRLAALQTMFANEGKTLTADDSNQEYLDA